MDDEELYEPIRIFVIDAGRASVSAIQRRFALGYNQATRIVEQLEQNGICSPMKASGIRDILVK